MTSEPSEEPRIYLIDEEEEDFPAMWTLPTRTIPPIAEHRIIWVLFGIEDAERSAIALRRSLAATAHANGYRVKVWRRGTILVTARIGSRNSYEVAPAAHGVLLDRLAAADVPSPSAIVTFHAGPGVRFYAIEQLIQTSATDAR